MSSSKLINLPFQLAGKTYPLLVAPEEVEAIRQLEAQLQRELDGLQARYGSNLSKQDLLAMLLITYAQKVAELSQNTDAVAVHDKIHTLLARLDSALQVK